MMMKNPTCPIHSNTNALAWSWATVQKALPNGLPAGALTVIRLRASKDLSRHWDNTVADLVHSTLADGTPVGYVPVDSDNPHQEINKIAMRRGEGGRLGILLDEDDLVWVRDFLGRPRTYGCGIPTGDRVREQVSGWEDDYGPSLVVVDGLERSRPHLDISRDVVALPDGSTMTRRRVSEMRALALRGYAESRPHAPTVVVWYDDSSSAHSEAVELLCDVAMVIVEPISSAEGDVIAISQRSNANQRFPYQQFVRVG